MKQAKPSLKKRLDFAIESLMSGGINLLSKVDHMRAVHCTDRDKRMLLSDLEDIRELLKYRLQMVSEVRSMIIRKGKK